MREIINFIWISVFCLLLFPILPRIVWRILAQIRASRSHSLSVSYSIKILVVYFILCSTLSDHTWSLPILHTAPSAEIGASDSRIYFRYTYNVTCPCAIWWWCTITQTCHWVLLRSLRFALFFRVRQLIDLNKTNLKNINKWPLYPRAINPICTIITAKFNSFIVEIAAAFKSVAIVTDCDWYTFKYMHTHIHYRTIKMYSVHCCWSIWINWYKSDIIFFVRSTQVFKRKSNEIALWINVTPFDQFE